MELGDLLFWPFAALCVLCAVIVVTRKNPIYSAFFLIGCFLTIALLFVTLDSNFIAAMHVLVYTGAIMVLFLFIIMLLNLQKEELGEEYPKNVKIITALVCAALFMLLAAVFYKDVPDKTMPPTKDFGSIEKVAESLFTRFVLPFELISLLIITAIIGAIVLVKKS